MLNLFRLLFQRGESVIDFTAYDAIPVQVEGPKIDPIESVFIFLNQFKDIDFGETINLNIQVNILSKF